MSDIHIEDEPVGPAVAVSWFNNSSNDGSSCFDVRFLADGSVQTRNSRRPEVVTAYTAEEWDAFVLGAKIGKFDRPVA